MTSARSRRRLHIRLAAIILTSALIVATLGFLANLMSGAFGSMTDAANQIDDTRAISATNGALQAMQKQLGATVRDNAYWDDAFNKINAIGGADWAVENWGTTTADYPLYDTALVIEADSKPLVAYHAGTSLAAPFDFYDGSFKDILAAAHRPDPNRNHLPVTFIRTKEGVAIIGAAAIQPSAMDPKADPATYKVLVFSKQMTTAVLADLARNFNIKGLAMSEAVDEALLHAEIKDINGKDIAHFTWPSERPGTKSYDRVRSTVISAAVILLALLGAIAVTGLAALRGARYEERVSNHRATHDALTDLWNRAGLLDQLESALETAGATTVSLHILDLDGFKPVNDAWGHAVGDELIKAVADRLVRQLPAHAVIARLGGDEFAVISNRSPLTGFSSVVPDCIQQTLSTPFVIGDRTIEIGGSVGTSISGPGALDSGELLRQADLALYRAKGLGRGISVNFDPSLDEEASKTAELEQELRQGLTRGELHVAFQPLIDAASREVSGVEALARWTSPSRGNVPPDVFITVAEKAGLIDQLGFQILETAVSEGANWPDIGIAVNISPLQLKNPYFVGQVEGILRSREFDPTRLTIEVTEGVLISNPEQAKRAFEALRKLGVKIALDDFGCGYAGIGALREFGFDRMKIDRSLVVALDHDDKEGAVLQATVALANALHLPVTAEGIETEEQATAARLSGCDKLQGYLFSRPISAKEITARYFTPNPNPLSRTG
ncbi:MAG: diguanylate cyclase/phosphodiesterase [Rhizobium sp.]|nr:diguanylate cyclase/phosphodiesterase [Rhizobium sp.]